MYDIKLEIDGRTYVLAPSDDRKEGDPIPFYITKKDMEFHMYYINQAVGFLKKYKDEPVLRSLYYNLMRTQKDFQHMIDKEIEKGMWK